MSYLPGPVCTLTLAAMSAVSAAPENAPERATVRFEARQPVTVGAHGVTPVWGSQPDPPPAFARLCTTPCTTELAVGDHTLALLRDDRPPLVVFPALRVSGPTTLQLTVNSRESERTLGFWITVLSLSLGAATTAVGLIPTCGDDDSCARSTSWAIWGGVGIASIGGTFGIPLMLREDEVTWRVAPAGHAMSRK